MFGYVMLNKPLKAHFKKSVLTHAGNQLFIQTCIKKTFSNEKLLELQYLVFSLI